MKSRNVFFRSMCVNIFLLSLCFVVLLSGCTLAPTYHRPDAPIPNTYKNQESAEGITLPVWKEFFVDPVMQVYIETALVNNRDLRIAMLNIAKTRNQYRIQRADILPTINAVGQEAMQHVTAEFSPVGEASFTRQYTASLGFSGFELDLFGRIRSLTDQALELYYSTEQEARSAQLSLVAEVAAMYLQLIADRELLDYTLATVKTYEDHYAMMERRYASGIASRLDFNQAKSSLESARSSLADYKIRVAQDENYLQLLLGGPLSVDTPEVRKLKDVQALGSIPAGLPSTLLERRPDIQAAEHRLKAANANIGAARANFFPRISLTGNIGTVSADFAELFSGSAGTWNFLPMITLPLFDTGRNIAMLRVSQSERDIAVASYEKSIQVAFREVADALSQRENITDKLAADAEQAKLAAESYILALQRYKSGVDSYIVLLSAQRMDFAAQQVYVASLLQKEVNALTVYKVLGGGWQ